MNKKIGIIYDTHHPLIEKVSEYLLESGNETTYIHYSTLSLNPLDKSLLDNFSAVYLDRMGETTRSYTTQLELLDCLQRSSKKTPIINAPKAYAIARNKAISSQIFVEKNISTPPTAIIYTLAQLDTLHQKMDTEFLIVKPFLGCCGEDIHIFPSKNSDAKISYILKRDGLAVVQPFMANPNRFIWRVDVVNRVVIVCNQRFSYNFQDELPICNGTLGGEIKFWDPDQLPEDVKVAAIRAVDLLGLDVAGVDLLQSEDGSLYILEVNPEPDITLNRFEFPLSIAKYLESL